MVFVRRQSELPLGHLVGWLLAGQSNVDLRTQVLITAANIIITSAPCRIAFTRTAEIGFALATKTSYNHSTAEHRLAKGDNVTSSTSFTHNHDRGSAQRQTGKEDSGEMQ